MNSTKSINNNTVKKGFNCLRNIWNVNDYSQNYSQHI